MNDLQDSDDCYPWVGAITTPAVMPPEKKPRAPLSKIRMLNKIAKGTLVAEFSGLGLYLAYNAVAPDASLEQITVAGAGVLVCLGIVQAATAAKSPAPLKP